MSGEYIYTAKDIVRITGCTRATVYRRIQDGEKICGVKIETIRTKGDDDGNIRVSKTSFELLQKRLGVKG